MQAFINEGRSFTELPREALPGVAVGRGLAIADFWNDGRIGAIVNNLDGAPALYRPVAAARSYIELLLEGKTIRDATGAVVTLRWQGGRAPRLVASGGSYLSSHDHRVHAGVGTASEVEADITWPAGEVQTIGPLKTNGRYPCGRVVNRLPCDDDVLRMFAGHRLLPGLRRHDTSTSCLNRRRRAAAPS